MKTRLLTIAAGAASIVLVTLLIANADQSTSPAVPVGTLDAFPVKVQAGTKPTLDWDTTLPEEIIDVIDIIPPGRIDPEEDLNMEIRVLGASYQIGWNRGQPVWGTVDSRVRVGSGSSFQQLWYGKQDSINPTNVYFSSSVDEGQTIDIAARCHNGSSWRDWRATHWGFTNNVTALANGDTPPSSVPAFSQGNIEDYLAPYLDENGNVNIGPLDVIYLIELGQTDTNASGFDMQDLVLLITFERVSS